MRILGIETSCDETAAAVVESGRRIVSNVVSSQIPLHRRYRGIVPELAARAHFKKIPSVIERAWASAGRGRLDAVAYTQGPGLMGPLLVGKVAAQAFAQIHDVPLIGVHHLEAHIFAADLHERLRFPLLGLIVSGGHTDLILARGAGSYEVLGRTRDDAAGEAFDKVARMLGLDYPGGPVIDRLAQSGDPEAIPFPRPLMPDSWDFSFSGLKTAVLYHLRKRSAAKIGRQECADICASFQAAVVDTLVWKAAAAVKRLGVKNVVLGGGVGANSLLRSRLAEEGVRRDFRAAIPPRALCMDNGAMIAQAAIRMLAPRPWSRPSRGGGKPPALTRPAGRAPRVNPSLPFRNWGR